MKAVIIILALAVVFCLFAGLLTAVGVGIGFAINWCFSSIDLGDAAIAGCVVSVASTFFLLKLLLFMVRKGDEMDDDFPDDDAILIMPRNLSRHFTAKSKPRPKRQ